MRVQNIRVNLVNLGNLGSPTKKPVVVRVQAIRVNLVNLNPPHVHRLEKLTILYIPIVVIILNGPEQGRD